MYVHACGSQVLEDANTEDLLFFTHTHSHTHTHMTTSGEYKTHTHSHTHGSQVLANANAAGSADFCAFIDANEAANWLPFFPQHSS